MSTSQVSPVPEPIIHHVTSPSPLFGRSPSPDHSTPNIETSPRAAEQVQDREDAMDHESTSPPVEAVTSRPQSEEDEIVEENAQDEMQLDNNEAPNITAILAPLPPMSQLLSGFDINPIPRELPPPPIFANLPPLQSTIIPTPSNDVQVSERDIPTPPPPSTSQPISLNPPPMPSDDIAPPPPPPIMDEEEDDFDGQTHFLQHFQEDTSEIPPEQLEEMARQERSGSRNFQLSGLSDDHWIKQVETSIDDPAFVPLERGKFTWNLEQFHGTKENPIKERILRSPQFTIGGFKWNIKLFPHGCEGTDYVSVHLECNGREIEDESKPWDVAAQIGCVMYNPTEPRTHHFERASHHFESSNSDWGWVRFYGPWQELHIRRFLEHRPMLQNDKLTITTFIRVWQDPTKLLWSSNLKNGQWDSFKQTGFRGLVADSSMSTAYASALSILFHSSVFNNIIATAPRDDPIRRPQQKRSPMVQEVKNFLRVWHDPSSRSSAVSLSEIQRLVSWYGYRFDGSTDIIQIWQALSNILILELSNNSSLQNTKKASGSMALIRDRQPPIAPGMSTSGSERKEYKSVQDIFSNVANNRSLVWESLFGSTTSNIDTPEVIAVEIKRSKYDTKKRKWCKLTHNVKIDKTVKINSGTYSLRGAVIHRGELGSGDFYSVIRPEGSENWLKYRNTQVSFLTHKQAIEAHEGKGEGKVSTETIAYLLVYGRDDEAGVFPAREVFQEQGVFTSLEYKAPELRPDDSIPVVIHDAKFITEHQGLGFVDPFSSNQSNIINMNIRASATLADIQGELLDRLKGSGRVERKDQLRLWPIRTTQDAPRFVLELDDNERWPDTQLLEFVQETGGAHLWLEIMSIDMLDADSDTKPDPMETSTSNLQASHSSNNNDQTDVVMANTEDEASESGSERDGDEENDEDEDGSSDSNHSDWGLTDYPYVMLKLWSPQLLRLSCQGTHFVPETKQNVLDFVRKTLKYPTSQNFKVYQETGIVLDKELSPSCEFSAFDSQVVVLVVSPELPDKIQEQRRKAGEPVSAPDWYKILEDKRDPTYKRPCVVRDFFGGQYVSYSTTATLPRRKSIVVDTKGNAFVGDLDLNWVKNGNGTMVYNNGNKYDGEWKDDLAEGHGIMTYHPSGNRYEGGWMGGRRHGKGVMYYEQSEDQLRTCKICYEEEMNTVLVKCGHIVACHGCAKELKDCPVCRRTIQDIVRMWPTV